MNHAHLRAVLVGGIVAGCLSSACLGPPEVEATSGAVTGLDFTSAPMVQIPDDDPRGVSDTIAVVPSVALGPVSSVTVDVDIRHERANELEIVLEHAGASVTLYAGGGTVQPDLRRRFVSDGGFDGVSPAGDWTLRVFDGGERDVGWLLRWSLHLEVEGDPNGESEARIDASSNLERPIPIPDADRSGITSALFIRSPTEGAFVTRVTVDVSIRHPDIGDLRVALVHGEQRVLLHNRSGIRTTDLVRSYAIESAFDGVEASGAWTLEVADEVGVDIGVLTGWEVHVYLATYGPVEANPSWDQTSLPQRAIPDGDPAGISDTISIPFWDTDWLGAIPWSDRRHTVLVDVDIEHDFVGDLIVSIEHRGHAVMLQHRQGGAQTNLVRTFRLDQDYARSPVDGEWTLHVVDAARIDEGTLRSWRLRIESVD